tara:strand:- start:4190 stop:4495 length:306 start_codon:yes stop_codon:yes gene_type:complete
MWKDEIRKNPTSVDELNDALEEANLNDAILEGDIPLLLYLSPNLMLPRLLADILRNGHNEAYKAELDRIIDEMKRDNRVDYINSVIEQYRLDKNEDANFPD